MSDEEDELYSITVEYTVSPEELHEFTDYLEAGGYQVVTDLSKGKLKVYEGD